MTDIPDRKIHREPDAYEPAAIPPDDDTEREDAAGGEWQRLLDHCPTCGRRIKDDDPNGCELPDGQRWCQDHRPDGHNPGDPEDPAIANVLLLDKKHIIHSLNIAAERFDECMATMQQQAAAERDKGDAPGMGGWVSLARQFAIYAAESRAIAAALEDAYELTACVEDPRLAKEHNDAIRAARDVKLPPLPTTPPTLADTAVARHLTASQQERRREAQELAGD